MLLRGDSGTGKELFAKLIHSRSPRARGPYVCVNCAAIPDELIESELFGHEKGSFTGATEKQIGKFEKADRGTIVLDEVGDMSAKAQAKMLRVLQEGEVERLGSARTVKVDVRVIAATNNDLETKIAQRLFREDLYYRLNVISIRLPSLRDRRSDIPLLATHFVAQFGAEAGKRNLRLTATAMHRLEQYAWPGNVHELQNCMQRAVVLHGGGLEIGADEIGLPSEDPVAAASKAREADVFTQPSALARCVVDAVRDSVATAPVLETSDYEKRIKPAIRRTVQAALEDRSIRINPADVTRHLENAIDIAWDQLADEGLRWTTDGVKGNKTQRQKALVNMALKEFRRSAHSFSQH